MKRKIKDKLITILFMIIPTILFILACAFVIYVFIEYKDKPIQETPNWVRWIMDNRR